jgi:hypothetical protein
MIKLLSFLSRQRTNDSYNSCDEQLKRRKNTRTTEQKKSQLAYNPHQLKMKLKCCPTTVEIDKATTEQARMKRCIALKRIKKILTLMAVTNRC